MCFPFWLQGGGPFLESKEFITFKTEKQDIRNEGCQNDAELSGKDVRLRYTTTLNLQQRKQPWSC